MDDADRSDNLINSVVEIAVHKAAENLTDPRAINTGKCLWCGEEQLEDRRWCDADCRDLWEKVCSKKLP